MKQHGLSMIEILVTLTIVAFGLLGILGLQARALSYQKDSFDRKAAAELVSQLAEVMRANQQGFNEGRYNRDLDVPTATPGAVTTCAPPCTVTQVATRDLDEFLIEMRRRLPASGAYIRWNAVDPTTAQVSIAWAEPLSSTAAAQDAVCDALRAGPPARAIPMNFRCYQARVHP
jgi:type IV pilus assembly protein PilV